MGSQAFWPDRRPLWSSRGKSNYQWYSWSAVGRRAKILSPEGQLARELACAHLQRGTEKSKRKRAIDAGGCDLESALLLQKHLNVLL